MKSNNKTLNELAGKGISAILVTIDETEYWREDIKELAGKIDGVYLINLREPTHLCSLDISYPAYFVSNYFHSVEGFNEDELSDMERGVGNDDYVSYFTGNSTFNIKKTYRSGQFEDLMEYEMCNPTVC